MKNPSRTEAGQLPKNASRLGAVLTTAVLILAAGILTVIFFVRIPIAGTTLALDWIGIRAGVTGWDLVYGAESALRIPPWSALLLVPVGKLPLQAGWGVVAFLTFATVILSLAWNRLKGGAFLLFALLLALGFPVVRTIVDGNIEFLIIAGLLLLEAGLLLRQPLLLALGVLLAATKVQETWILLIFLPLLAGREWWSRKGLQAAGVAVLVAVPCLIWKGREWIESVVTSQYRGSIMDSSLLTTLHRLGFSNEAGYVCWGVLLLASFFLAGKYCRGASRVAFTFLLSASLLLAPYAAGNNVIVIYVLGAIPLLLERRWEGAALFGLINLPYVFLAARDLMYWWSAPYWTLVLLIAWVLCARRMRAQQPDNGKTPLAPAKP
jgi:uncharacterized membrane protein